MSPGRQADRNSRESQEVAPVRRGRVARDASAAVTIACSSANCLPASPLHRHRSL